MMGYFLALRYSGEDDRKGPYFHEAYILRKTRKLTYLIKDIDALGRGRRVV